MTAVRLWIRRDARRRVHSLVVLAALVAVAGGVVLAAIAGGRRNGSAVTRATARTFPADVLALPNEPGFDWDAVRALPEVAAVGEFPVTVLLIDGIVDHYDPDVVGFPPGSPEAGTTVERPIVVDGRLADRARVDEVTIAPSTRDLGVAIGDHLTIRMYAGATLAKGFFDGSFPESPDGPVQDVVVVGVTKDAFFGSAIQVTEAFLDRYRSDLVPPEAFVNAAVRLRHGAADLPAFQADLTRVAGHPVELQNQHDVRRHATNATSLERGALYAFAAAAGVASLVLVGQALLRVLNASSAEIPLLRALGFTRREELIAVGLAPTVAAVAGALAAIPVAYALSARFPIGIGRRWEPSPGYHADWLVLGVGALVLAVLGVAGCALIGWRQLRQAVAGVAPVRSSRAAAAFAALGAPVPMALGTRLALERGRGPSNVPVRPALAGAIVGVLGIVGALTFHDGLDRAAADPTLYGQRFDALWIGVGAAGPPPDTLAGLTADRDVDMVEEIRNTTLLVNGHDVSVMGVHDLRGDYGLVPVAGRLPTRADEISFAPKQMTALGVGIGDQVLVGDDRVPMTVVGETFTPEISHTAYDDGARMSDDALRRFVPDDADLKFHVFAIRFRHGVDRGATFARLNDDVAHGTLEGSVPVEDQENLRGVRAVPVALGAFLALLAVAAVGHALASAVRRRRRDMAVLRTLGLTRRQARASVAWQATTLAIVGAVVGIPLGIAGGRVIWRHVAERTPVLYVSPLAAIAVALAAPATIAVANALAAWPGRIAARTRPAEVLRVE